MKYHFHIYDDTVIYIMSIKSVTGGPDALHQLSYYLNQLGYCSKMAYLYTNGPDDCEAPSAYICYNTQGIMIDDIIDNPHNVVIIPEPFSQYSKLYRKAQIGIWWLSVDNYFVREKKNDFKSRWGLAKGHRCIPMLFKYKLTDKRVINLTASYYAYEFLTDQGICARAMIEPLGLSFIEFMKEHKSCAVDKKNVVFYNPKKGVDITKEIIEKCSDIDFIPIQNMTYQQVLETLQTGKVYMDFGEFPGAERLPKEAAIAGCCILTGTRGASKNDYDVCIPRRYKYDDPLKHISDIHDQIIDFFENYEERCKDFEVYVNKVNALEINFKQSIKEIFLKG